VSLIFWSLIVVISIKYALLIMRADNHGEGGILALRVSPCTFISLSKRRSHLPVSGLPSRPDASSTPCRVPSGSFAKSLRAKSILVLGFMLVVFLEVDFQRMQ
jgi:hypothetical protein